MLCIQYSTSLTSHSATTQLSWPSLANELQSTSLAAITIHSVITEHLKMLKSTVTLDIGSSVLKDIQIWNDSLAYQEHKTLLLIYRCHVKYRRIPLFLVYNGASEVYTNDSQTEEYFFNKLISADPETGVLAKIKDIDAGNEQRDSHVVFFTGLDQSSIKCVFIDILLLQHAQELQQNLGPPASEDVLYPLDMDLGETAKSDTSIFDRVLENKSSKKSFTISNPQVQNRNMASDLTSNQQTVQTVNKIILSGLRLRGLISANATNLNEKYAVREIFQMTKQSALFALRKFSYDFNGSQGQKPTLEAMQDIVESLLQTFVDIETVTFKNQDSHR